MNLIACRPKTWSEIVGQDRIVSLLSSILTIGKFMPRGFILRGPWGVGKTSVAHLFSRALMCSGENLRGCGRCPSCQSIDKDGISYDPDFVKVDAASKPGVQDARDLLDRMIQPPTLGKRRVAVIDEAHRLSREAWDVFLEPLEEQDTHSIFLFVTTDGDRIPKTIQSRCLPLPFVRVAEGILTGLLASTAAKHEIEYELEALRAIARHSKGIVRDAIRWLNMAASLGKITLDTASQVLDDPLENVCVKVLLAVAVGNQKSAVKWVDEAGRLSNPTKVIETLFSVYARTLWSESESEEGGIAARLSNIREVNGIFLRWLGAHSLPSDALPLIVHELLDTVKIPRAPVKEEMSHMHSASSPGVGNLEKLMEKAS
jgi:DNA polymerase-3 subunit gamma/tau